MSLETLAEALRAVNVVLALVAAVAYALRVNNVWELQSAGRKWLRLGLIALLFATAYSSAESLAQQTDVGLRSVFITVACTTVLVGLWRTRKDPRRSIT